MNNFIGNILQLTENKYHTQNYFVLNWSIFAGQNIIILCRVTKK